jgi:metal-sulfur cluster biosynthetic enzyme
VYTQDQLIDFLRDVVDPDLGFPIVDLGLVYRAEDKGEWIEVDFTLTSPACPVGDLILEDIKAALTSATGIEDIRVQIVWNPPWDKDMMSEEMKLMLGIPI